ncbi:MAG: SRPBCC family protein [Lewinellaceae bacterium]|nr:SRPBCC family protein [Lewinellaceae bacterium]
MLKKILFVILGLIVLLLVVGAFAKKDYTVTREVVVNKPIGDVFNYIKLLKNQDNFSVWAAMDPAMKKSYRGEDGQVGFVSAWDSDNKNVGQGEQEIIAINDGSRIDYELRFMKPFEAKNKAYLTTEAAGDNATKVVWGFEGHMAFPSNLMLLFMNFDEMLGKDLQGGLDNLKKVVESLPETIVVPTEETPESTTEQ